MSGSESAQTNIQYQNSPTDYDNTDFELRPKLSLRLTPPAAVCRTSRVGGRPSAAWVFSDAVLRQNTYKQMLFAHF